MDLQMYGLHPSRELVSLFRAKPYQGQQPERAKIVFLGRDANYTEAISEHPFFQRILEYHDDGVAFWQRHGVHHPFLHPEYPFDRVRGGIKYHATFAKLGLGQEFASSVSFVELLDVATLGITGQDSGGTFDTLLNPEHLRRLDRLLTAGESRVVFLSSSVLAEMRKLGKRFGVFGGLSRGTPPMPCREAPVLQIGETEVHLVYHFSDGRVHAQLPDIRQTIELMVGIDGAGVFGDA